MSVDVVSVSLSFMLTRKVSLDLIGHVPSNMPDSLCPANVSSFEDNEAVIRKTVEKTTLHFEARA